MISKTKQQLKDLSQSKLSHDMIENIINGKQTKIDLTDFSLGAATHVLQIAANYTKGIEEIVYEGSLSDEMFKYFGSILYEDELKILNLANATIKILNFDSFKLFCGEVEKSKSLKQINIIDLDFCNIDTEERCLALLNQAIKNNGRIQKVTELTEENFFTRKNEIEKAFEETEKIFEKIEKKSSPENFLRSSLELDCDDKNPYSFEKAPFFQESKADIRLFVKNVEENQELELLEQNDTEESEINTSEKNEGDNYSETLSYSSSEEECSFENDRPIKILKIKSASSKVENAAAKSSFQFKQSLSLED